MIGNYFWGGGGAAPYEIEQSLRFDGSSNYLSRTPSSNTSTNKKGTFSCWMKVSSNSGTNGGTFIGAADSYHYAQFYDERFYFGNDSSYLGTAGRRRDYSAWYHVLYVFDTTLATTDDRTKIYVNGSRLASETFNTQPSQDSSFKFLNTTQVYNIGRRPTGNYWHGYMAECHFVDGTALDHEDFGELDESGVWRPIAYTGSHGTNGFYLKFDPSATNGIGHDHSGNGNNWTPSGFTTSGTGTDVMSDTPTNNFATINPVDQQNGTLSNGNLDLTATAYNYSTIGVTSGKYYLEYTVGTSGGSSYNFWFGARNLGHNFSGQKQVGMAMCNGGNQLNTYGVYTSTNGTVTNPTGSRPSLPATIGIKINLDDGEVEFLVNGSVNGKVTGITDFGSVPVGFFASHWTGTFSDFPCTVNFGQRAFANTVPTGYSTLSTSNLPAPDITDGSDYFNTLLWSGDGNNSRAITGLGFQPDFVWIKRRNQDIQHEWMDAVRGAGDKALSPHTTGEEGQGTTDLSSFNSDGFTLNSGADVNASGGTYVAWNWLAANGTSTPSGGSIASTVSANPTAGFSIVSYVGTFAADTIAHGLGNAPSMIITKSRDTADRWQVYHQALGNGYVLRLESYVAAGADAGAWNSTSPTSTVFSVGASVRTNRSGDNFIAYCFAEVEGYSKFGSYEGNNTDNSNAFVYLGFTPAFLMIKNIDASANWIIHDTTRDTYNPSDTDLYPNTSGSEATDNYMDFLSNGFKIRDTSGPSGNSNTYIYAAFASNPFGGSGVSPATAR